MQKIDYLGHMIFGDGVQANPSELQSMLDWPSPKTVKSLRGFFGLMGYYKKIINNYGSMAVPLTNLLKKCALQWSPATEASFNQLKQAVTQSPVLRLPYFLRRSLLSVILQAMD